MKAVLAPVGGEFEWFRHSAITEISNSDSGLRIVVAAPEGVDRYVEFHFPYARAFQAMDEGDMLEYWDPPLLGQHLIYEVESGGWIERAKGNYLHVTSAIDEIHEWLIVSADLCVSVLSTYTPHMREFG